jgi:antitoxin component HigA of HigAB toxin-antitoxin module
MYTCEKLLSIVEEMEKSESEEEIKKLAEKEFRIVEHCSERIGGIASRLKEEQKINHTQYELLDAFRQNVSFVQSALEDIMENKTARTMPEKIEYLKNLITSYEKKLDDLEVAMGDSMKHVKEEMEKLKEEVEKIE